MRMEFPRKSGRRVNCYLGCSCVNVRRLLAMLDLLMRVYTLNWVSTIPGEVHPGNPGEAAATALAVPGGSCPRGRSGTEMALSEGV